MIPGTKEFFIALSDHSEWGTAHNVWGEVEPVFYQPPMLFPLHLPRRTLTWKDPANCTGGRYGGCGCDCGSALP